MKKETYYIIERNSTDLLTQYIPLVKNSSFVAMEKVRFDNELLLIEKTIFKDENSSLEEVTNLWTMNDGISMPWRKYVKENIMLDYTGIVSPLVHLNGEVMTFEQYNQRKNESTK